MSNNSPEWINTDFPEYGRPTYKHTLDSLVSWRKDLISGPGTRELGDINSSEILKTTAYSPIEFQEPNKGEDRIFTGFIGDKYPVIVIADGVTFSTTSSGDVLSGVGGPAAEAATLNVVKRLADLKDGLSPVEVQYILKDAFLRAGEAIKHGGKNGAALPGATTLLVGFPYIHRGHPGAMENLALWHYGYVGDGDIVLISKGRKVDGRAIPTYLLTPQKVSSTAAISEEGPAVKPFIGMCEYTPGDGLLMTSDGFDGPNKEYVNKKQLSIPYVLGNDRRDPRLLLSDIAQTFRSLKFHDDGVLGFINTEVVKKVSLPR